MAEPEGYNYLALPPGYYDRIMRQGNPVRQAWHRQKFQRVIDLLPRRGGGSLLDVGCFAGTFLSMVSEQRFSQQLGVDILPEQIDYATRRFGAPFRRFVHMPNVEDLGRLEERFDYVTLIEVIEHLTAEEIRTLFQRLARLLKPGGTLIFSTPNYWSAWPLLEFLINKFSDISYADQHLTRFTYWGMENQLRRIWPELEQHFRFQTKTTTHFLSPFLAALVGVDWAGRVSSAIPHEHWHIPLGCLILATLQRQPNT